jgi:hypothetical protein
MSAATYMLDENLVRRIRSEFREIPGLRLTSAQAERLWGLDRVTCDAVVRHLTDTRVLGRSVDGRIFALQTEP